MQECDACRPHQWAARAALSGEFCHRRQRDPQKAALFPSGASGKGVDRASAGCGSAGCSWHLPTTHLPGAGHAGRGGLALPQEGTGPVCVSRLSPSHPHHSTGTPTELPLSLVAPRESPERLCPDGALLRLCCRAERGTASTDTSTSMVTPSLQTDTGLRAVVQRGTSPIPAQHSGSGEAVWKRCATPPAPSAQPCLPVGGVLALT